MKKTKKFLCIPAVIGLLLGANHHAQAATYTLDENFDLGTLQNVNHDPHNQLQLNEEKITPFPFVSIAISGRGTLVRIDVETGTILGEYLTSPDGMGRNPSRTTVDLHGNVWVANRDEGSNGLGSVARVGLIVGGERVDQNGTPDPDGAYLGPPFKYNTCVDRDNNGLIKTSHGLGDVLSWSNAGGADTNGGTSTADDECIINYTRTAGTGTRTVAIDKNNDVWVGGLGDLDHEKLNGVTGQPVPGTQFNLSCGGYGGLVDNNNILWSARGGNGLLRYDTVNESGYCLLGYDYGDYGLGIDPQTGHIWHTNIEGNRVAELDAAGNILNAYNHGDYYAQGVAVDSKGNVWVAHSLYRNTVGHLRTDGTLVGNINVGSGPTGVAVDSNGKVWVTNYYSFTAQRIDPDAGPIGGGGFKVGAVDMTVTLGANAYPYNYSDMTGAVSIGGMSPQGTWNIVQDSSIPGNMWGTITWNTEPEGSEPVGTSIIVEARAAATEAGLAGETFIAVTNGSPFSLTGQFIEVRSTLKASSDGISPILSDITVERLNHPPVALCQNRTVPTEPGLCVAGASVDAGSYDPDGDPITLMQSPAGPYPLDLTTVDLTVTDSWNESDVCSATVTVKDKESPVIQQVAASPNVLWPPNHKMVPVKMAVTVTDNCDSAPACKITTVSSNEPINGLGDGDTSPDWKITGDLTLNLRAERSGTGNGRMYTITTKCADGSGNTAIGTTTVTVPKSQGK